MGLTSSQRSDPDGFPYLSCGRETDNGTIEFSFGTGSIKVPYSALIHQSGGSRKDCFLAMGSAGTAPGDGDDWSILGSKPTPDTAKLEQATDQSLQWDFSKQLSVGYFLSVL